LLLKEVKYLEARVDFLQHLPQNSTADRLAAQKKRANKILEDAVRSQQFEFAGVQSALVGYAVRICARARTWSSCVLPAGN